MMAVLPVLAFCLLFLLYRRYEPSSRSAALAAAIAWGGLVILISEGLSVGDVLTAGWVAGLWVFICVALGVWVIRTIRLGHETSVMTYGSICPASWGALAGLGVILALVGLTALVSPPNNWDTLVYHMSRVQHWIQNRSIAHYPTHILRQLHLGPGAELVFLQFHILSGDDRLANLVQGVSLIGSLIGVSLIAKQLGAGPFGQIFAAVIAATIPMGLLQASTAKNDLVNSFWLVCFVFYVLRLTGGGLAMNEKKDWFHAGLSLGLALLTKAVVVPYSLPFMVWLLLAGWRKLGRRVWLPVLVFAAAAAAPNLGHSVRNMEVYGSPLGAGGLPCTYCTYFNDAFTPKVLFSNLLRNLGQHVATPWHPVNQSLEQGIYQLHAQLGLSIDDPRSTFGGMPFRIVRTSHEENYDGAPLHLVLILTVAAILVLSPRLHNRHALARYAVLLFSAFLLFSLLLKWHISNSRFHLGLFIIGAPLLAAVLVQFRWKRVAAGLVVVLLVSALPPLLWNYHRPLVGARTIFNVDRSEQYLMARPVLFQRYAEAARLLAAQRCSDVGLILGWDDPEYPLWILLQGSVQGPVRIEHVSVNNESAVLLRLEPFAGFNPCTTVRIMGEFDSVTISPAAP